VVHRAMAQLAEQQRGVDAEEEARRRAALDDLLAVEGAPVHLISTPSMSTTARERAERVKLENDDRPRTFCYNPSTDAPQDEGGGWAASWRRVCLRTKASRVRWHRLHPMRRGQERLLWRRHAQGLV